MVKKALCVGLNYPQKKFQLYGCVNDCLDWEHLLNNTYGFDETRVLIDQNPDGTLVTAPTQIPTHDNIVTQLGGWLCKDVNPGDVLAFIYAGHGCQVKHVNGRIDEALVPEDFSEASSDVLVTDDELHACFQKLPSGAFLTVILDCCHGSGMLDVPCSIDTSVMPNRTATMCERPVEVCTRTGPVWDKAFIPHAQARARFIPSVVLPAQRQRRIADGVGAHVNQMTLNPGVTAFLLSASRTPEMAMDASIKKHQCGVMSFCLLEALAEFRYKCTYEMLIAKAVERLEDIRAKYMTTMDQHIVLSFCPNSAPGQVVVFDEAYAAAAQYALSQQAATSGRQESVLSNDGHIAQAVREVSTDFVPSPSYHPPESSGQQQRQMRLFLIVHAAYNLASAVNGPCDPYVRTKVGREEYKTETLQNSVDPFWEKDHHFIFTVRAADVGLELDVVNAGRNELIGGTVVDLKALPPAQWHRQKAKLQDQHGRPVGQAELEFDMRLEQVDQAQPIASAADQAGNQTKRPVQQPPQEHEPPSLPIENHRRSQSSGPMGRPPSPGRQEDASRFQQETATEHGCMGRGCPHGSNGGASFPVNGSSPVAHGRSEEGFSLGVPDLFGTPNLFGVMPNLLTMVTPSAASTMPPTLPLGTSGLPPLPSRTSTSMPNGVLSASMLPLSTAYSGLYQGYSPAQVNYAAPVAAPTATTIAAPVIASSYKTSPGVLHNPGAGSHSAVGTWTAPSEPVMRAPSSAPTVTTGVVAAPLCTTVVPQVVSQAYSGMPVGQPIGSASIGQPPMAMGYSPQPHGRRLY